MTSYFRTRHSSRETEELIDVVAGNMNSNGNEKEAAIRTSILDMVRLEWGPVVDVQQAPSAQHAVWILKCQSGEKLVVRQWQSARTWWNLHCPGDGDRRVEDAAKSEIASYRWALEVLPHIPKVLKSGKDWAIFEYIESWPSTWQETMVPFRHEFGFEEPHPRWGRVPVDSCLAYARQLLEQVVVPLHKAQSSRVSLDVAQPEPGRGYRYSDMLQLYRRTYDNTLVTTCTHNRNENNPRTQLFQPAIELLGLAIAQLKKEAIRAKLVTVDNKDDESTNALPCVLCHMDLQPQNILFESDTTIRSVLDWEEAAYADPRFDLLLLCRKVLANKDQADHLWQYYQQLTSTNLGPLEPWLKLETVHSLTTLLLQACAGGGRSPWENQNDLWAKIDREFQRLKAWGWTFCQLPAERSI